MISTLPAPTYTPAADAAPRYSLQLSDLPSADADADADALAPPPAYTPPAPPGIVQLQIQTPGKPWLSLPTPTRPDPIPVFDVGSSGNNSNTPLYISLRQSRSSGTCYLVAGDDAGTGTMLSDTTYRFGPGRPPRVRLWLPGHGPSVSTTTTTTTDNDNDAPTAYEEFEIRPSGLLTRAHRFRTRHHGEFEWRYATRRERADVAGQLSSETETETVDSLLVLERIVRTYRDPRGAASSSSAVVTGGAPDGAPDEDRTVVAQLVRGGGGLRAAGSTARDAGNGGRLFVDVCAFGNGVDGDNGEDDGGSGKAKAGRDMVVVLAVTTCLCMLKKEVDRRRMHQMAIMAGAASGGS